MKPTLSIKDLGSGRARGTIAGKAVIRHCASQTHSFFALQSSELYELQLFFALPAPRPSIATKRLCMSGYSVTIFADGMDNDREYLCLNGAKGKRSKVFGLVVEYLINKLSVDTSKRPTWEAVCDTLREYRRMHSIEARKGLSDQELAGLYGGLFVMKEVLMPAVRNWGRVLGYWQGYLAERQDFKGPNWVLEVKTNHAIKADTLWINGLAQLRTIPGKKLFLCHLHFNSATQGGSSIVKLIDEIRQSLADDTLRTKFNSSILQAGYDESLALDWDYLRFASPEEVTFYDVLRQGTPYKFPRVTETEAEEFIEDMKYKVRRDNLAPFIIPERDFIKTLCGRCFLTSNAQANARCEKNRKSGADRRIR